MSKYYVIYNISYDKYEPLCINNNLDEVEELTLKYQKIERIKYGNYKEVTEEEYLKVTAGKSL